MNKLLWVLALTAPVVGAVAKPAGFDIGLPFVEGEEVYVSSGYGPGGGSSLHAGTDEAAKTNDYYALDFILPKHSNNGLGQPVVAIAAGKVVKAGWATAGWANYGLRVIIEHDYNADGHKYLSLYAHLNALSVGEGAHVGKGERIGELGDSCDGDNKQLSCPSFNPHLHFAIHQDSNIGGSGTGGSYGGHATVPEPFNGYEDIQKGLTLVSKNSGGPSQPCMVIPPSETILDDTGPCFSRSGPPEYWHDENAGHGGHCVWTYTIDKPQPDNYAQWNLHFEQAGDYGLWAFIPAAFGESKKSRYRVMHDGVEDALVRAQADAPDGWLDLGSHHFAQGGGQWVRLQDNTGEPYVSSTDNTKIVFDALKIAPASPCECQAGDAPQSRACGLCGTESRACDGCKWGGWSACGGEGVCNPLIVEHRPCDGGGGQARECGDNCNWGAWGECAAGMDAGAQDGSSDDGTMERDATAPDGGAQDAKTTDSGADAGPAVDAQAPGDSGKPPSETGAEPFEYDTLGCGCSTLQMR
ncbi:MAG: M23 family metallopeptidase [Deltaproteobacteria bacterium]|nr:M23 family metallopeptidase [Deltaproteobacteria bacterium]